MTSRLELAHFGLRTRDLESAIAWYGKVLGAEVRFRNELAAFMSFDEEHHRLVIWDDGETGEKPADAGGVDHIGFSCGTPSALADAFERLQRLGIEPSLCVNHGFTSSIYVNDPDGNEVEFTCDNLPTKQDCADFMATEEMAKAMQPPLFGNAFDPEELLRLRKAGAPDSQLARIGL
jgi:catechol-2,3-dioxygenase